MSATTSRPGVQVLLCPRCFTVRHTAIPGDTRCCGAEMQDVTPSEFGPPNQFTIADVRNLFRLAEEKKHLRHLAWWAVFAAVCGWGLAIAGWLR